MNFKKKKKHQFVYESNIFSNKYINLDNYKRYLDKEIYQNLFSKKKQIKNRYRKLLKKSFTTSKNQKLLSRKRYSKLVNSNKTNAIVLHKNQKKLNRKKVKSKHKKKTKTKNN